MNDYLLIAILGGLMILVFEPVYLHLCYNPPKKAPVAIQLFFKALATSMAVIPVIIGYIRKPDAFSLLMLAGISVCLIADVLIGVKFVVGVGAFLLGHLFYMPAFLSLYDFVWWQSAIIFFAALTLVYFLFRKHFAKAGKLLIPCLIYCVVLTEMLAIGIPAAVCGGARAICVPLGAALFFVSDITLARNVFVAKTPLSDTVSLTFYYAAQFTLALAVFLPTIA